MYGDGPHADAFRERSELRRVPASRHPSQPHFQVTGPRHGVHQPPRSAAPRVKIAHQADPQSAPVTSLAGPPHVEIDVSAPALGRQFGGLRNPAGLAAHQLPHQSSATARRPRGAAHDVWPPAREASQATIFRWRLGAPDRDAAAAEREIGHARHRRTRTRRRRDIGRWQKPSPIGFL